MIIYVDIDETICACDDTANRSYETTKPIQANIDKVNALYAAGHTIVFWTARGSRTGINWYGLTKRQLDSWGVKYHELRCDKPYYDLFLEDKSARIEDYIP